MIRRDFLKLLGASAPFILCGCGTAHLWRGHTHEPDIGDLAEVSSATTHADHSKVTNFDQDFADDIFCTPEKFKLMQSLVVKFRAVQSHAGHGNFNLLGMDEFILLAHHARGIEALTTNEKNFLEELFFFDAKLYGFYGDKSFHHFTDTIKKSNVEKVPYTGHYLRKGKSLQTYQKIVQDIGNSVVLKSLVPALAKQLHLFIEKTISTNGNMSRASRSLAPPGYSFHGHEDFDIGRVNYGLKNFTDEFAQTEEFKALQRLGYAEIRYTEANNLGVRFEPWHIKVTS